MPANEDLDKATVSKSKSFSKKPLTTPQMDVPEGFIRLGGPIERDNIVNGDGLRAVVWAQGCRQHCPGCQNPETWDENAGILVKIEDVKNELCQIEGQTGLTFCGGEPLLQAAACKEIAEWARTELGWNIWSFTGLVYEDIKASGGLEWEFVKSLDALIDGPFILSQRDLGVRFRGSRNQRILHLKNGDIVSQE
ncbi:MAG: radical SAM protein [Candidatus Nomurabacteria bacterium]|jgi:anaerobic ribonucleoside-triphosphate reductase activating protein|nr:radical SAM protein [Candidatus Nomurabacteria bacterium]